MRLAFDLETDGLLDTVSKIHCLVCKDIDTGKAYRFRCNEKEDNISEGLLFLKEASTLIGHNIIGYDLEVIKKLFPDWTTKARIIDTQIAAELIYTNIVDLDMAKVRKGTLDPKCVRRHSLKAWGCRLGVYKGSFAVEDEAKRWDTWTPEMEDYCEQDVEVAAALFKLIESENYSQEAIALEMEVKAILVKQEQHGFLFDKAKAVSLYETLCKRRMELEAELRGVFKPWEVLVKRFTPKVNNKKSGYVKGVPIDVYKTVEFNPTSRDHIADRLIKLRGWKPTVFTDGGKPQVDDVVLKGLPYPEIPLLLEYLLIQKRISQLAEGGEAWLKAVSPVDGRIHGRVRCNGAVTGRMTHSKPNMAQVPACGSTYGEECRELFTVPKGYKLVGCDASGLELRMLAHYLAKWDGGEYTEAVLGGDIHTFNQTKAGLPTRNIAKRFIYAWLYGAGDAKIGEIAGGDTRLGKKLKQDFLKGLPAVKKLLEGVQTKAKTKKYLIGLDGRKLMVRSAHSALNMLLQSAGALVMKKALVILNAQITQLGLAAHFVGNIHDEWQIEVREDQACIVADLGREAIKLAGEYFNLRCPLDGSTEIGDNWKETH